LCFGLYKIASALRFLNTDCHLVHGNVNISSIFTTRAGEWKLGGMELLSALAEDGSMVQLYRNFMSHTAKYLPPELRNGKPIPQGVPTHFIDAWEYGCLIQEIFNGPFTNPEYLGVCGSIPQNLYKHFQGFLQADPRSRLDFPSFLDHAASRGSYFDDDFVSTSLFLEQIALKESHEKDQYLE
jgi:SCY1-like protein 1